MATAAEGRARSLGIGRAPLDAFELHDLAAMGGPLGKRPGGDGRCAENDRPRTVAAWSSRDTILNLRPRSPGLTWLQELRMVSPELWMPDFGPRRRDLGGGDRAGHPEEQVRA